MKLVSTFAARGAWRHGLRRLQLPMMVELDGYGTFDVSEEPIPAGAIELTPGRHWPNLLICGRRDVDPARLIVVKDIFSAHGAAKALDTAEADLDRLIEGVHFVAGSISFATGAALEVMTAFGSEFQNEFVAENDADKERLREIGTHRARISLAPTNGVEIFADTSVDGTFIAALASRRIASLYADALGDLSPSTRFLSLWRTLEFAFQARQERELIPLILAYPEVQAMGFDHQELKGLRDLRGKLAHAVSRSGLGAVLDASTDAIHQIGRLWSLVDWVVLSKEGPGQDLRADPLAELSAFIDRGGRVQMVNDKADPSEWLDSWSELSPRFRN